MQRGCQQIPDDLFARSFDMLQVRVVRDAAVRCTFYKRVDHVNIVSYLAKPAFSLSYLFLRRKKALESHKRNSSHVYSAVLPTEK